MKFSGIIIISCPFGVCGLIIKYIVDDLFFSNTGKEIEQPFLDLHLEDEHCTSKLFFLYNTSRVYTLKTG